MEIIDTNSQNIERAIKELLIAIGEDPTREGLQGTPDRIARMYKEIFKGYNSKEKPKITTFSQTKTEGSTSLADNLIFDSGTFNSMCEHHMLPFYGTYYFAYIPSPKGKILGLSKIARAVEYCSSRLQLQEKLANDILDLLEEALEKEVLGMALVLKGRHMCKTMRGVKNNGEMIVSCFRGVFANDKDASILKEQFYNMIKLTKNQ